ncbi:hypothetical protein WN943_014659 [Citrus x changshan-huyou]
MILEDHAFRGIFYFCETTRPRFSGSEIQNCPHIVKLPNCPRRTTVTGIQATETGKLRSKSFGHSGSNGTGSDLPRAATAPESSSAAVKVQQLAGGETVTPGGCESSGIEEGVVGNKIQPVVSPKTGEKSGRASRQASDWCQACPVGWSEAQDMAGSISGQKVHPLATTDDDKDETSSGFDWKMAKWGMRLDW